jgi:hypothetical protein
MLFLQRDAFCRAANQCDAILPYTASEPFAAPAGRNLNFRANLNVAYGPHSGRESNIVQCRRCAIVDIHPPKLAPGFDVGLYSGIVSS